MIHRVIYTIDGGRESPSHQVWLVSYHVGFLSGLRARFARSVRSEAPPCITLIHERAATRADGTHSARQQPGRVPKSTQSHPPRSPQQTRHSVSRHCTIAFLRKSTSASNTAAGGPCKSTNWNNKSTVQTHYDSPRTPRQYPKPDLSS